MSVLRSGGKETFKGTVSHECAPVWGQKKRFKGQSHTTDKIMSAKKSATEL
jgi:hypothetical protein